MSCHANKCVECTVSQCANHCDHENYCSLDRILVGTHEANPTCLLYTSPSPRDRV